MVTDFGIARAITEGSDARLTATGMAIGTPAYMSPEQSTGDREVDGRSDLYSLGIVGYQMLTGVLPFNANSTPALLVKHLSEAPAPVYQRCPDVAPDLGRAIMLLLEKDPAHRFADAGALATALESRDVPEPRAAVVSSPLYGAASQTGRGLESATATVISRDDLQRWEQPQVRAFRRKVGPWAFWGGVSIVLNLFGVIDLVGLWGMYTLYIAWKYAKLWTDGFDWRDVLKEPRDRLLLDVMAEWTDNVRGLWDPAKRAEVRERARRKGGSPLFERASDRSAALPGLTAPNELALRGSQGDVVRAAARNRDEVLRLVESLPKSDRALLSDVPASASELYARVETLARSVAEIERTLPAEMPPDVDREIARLEAEANPLDVDRSEERVRRLALLKRQRRTVADLSQRLNGHKERMESCAVALENMRLDVLRLRSGAQTFEHITSVAEKAVALAREVDTAMYVKDEMSKLGRRSAGSAGR
jgi:serine/threonine-protein kinase